MDTLRPDSEWDSIHRGLFRKYQDRTAQLYAPASKEPEGINAFLVKLQTLGRYSPDRAFVPEEFSLSEGFIEKESICFTLWWKDGAQEQHGGHPAAEDIRVRVHAHALIDHVTVSFFIDAGKGWNAEPVYHSADAVGDRRKRIFREVEKVKAICEGRLQSGIVEAALSPEKDVGSEPEGDAAALLHASDDLYAGIWGEFCESFGFKLEDMVTPYGECFFTSRGVVLSTRGLWFCKSDGPHYSYHPSAGIDEATYRLSSSPGQEPFQRFRAEETGETSNEANAVLKAFWPFLRRMIPEADNRDFLGCGVWGWRALLAGAVGTGSGQNAAEEWDRASAPANEMLPIPGPDPAIRFEENQQPLVRYAFLVKCEPHRKQLGRIVDRLLHISTIRNVVLKDINVIRNASPQLRIRGQELDAVMSWWSFHSRRADRMLWQKEKAIGAGPKPTRWWRIKRWLNYWNEQQKLYDARDERDRKLTAIAEEAEKYLIDISAALDYLGRDAVGGLHYRINRAIHYTREFDLLVKTLKVGDVDSWISYSSFADRGVKPIFDTIIQTGERLRALRERLIVVTESIQTSALVVQTAATRNNTEILRKIATAAWAAVAGVFGLTAYVLGVLNDITHWLQNIPHNILDAMRHWFGG